MRLATVEVASRDTDQYSLLTRVAFGGALPAVVFAVVGLPPIPLHSPFHYAGFDGAELRAHAGDSGARARLHR